MNLEKSGGREETKDESSARGPEPEQKSEQNLPPESSAEKKAGIDGSLERLRQIADMPGLPTEAAEEIRRLAADMSVQIKLDRAKVVIEIAGAAAHEINNALTALALSAELLKNDMREFPDDHPAHRRLDVITKAIERITGFLRDMQGANHYATQTYVKGTEIFDFNSAK